MFRPVLAIIRLSRQLDDGQYRPKHVVVSITVIKYTSVIKLCLTTYLFLVVGGLGSSQNLCGHCGVEKSLLLLPGILPLFLSCAACTLVTIHMVPSRLTGVIDL